ncbi:pullulanase-type alpha-1,6-glucosidase [Brachybacterium sp. JHP9]|uniref:Pullulanase-type alpha-1,6-glucosidase n=1 Tax=Brachybacterium equifaecis TaxID=2910770 RepID=A0ABT0QX29_9MICO|nr:pullulanase-type alpha-1,6-glucosidase [Brachybacterium equifaecis]MCL6422227.1 pullulanase-type alpha-1,6-glucosidase [Brachybacterium equifaecis]
MAHLAPLPRRSTVARRAIAAASAALVGAAGLLSAAPLASALGPGSVVLAGSLQSELGCDIDWSTDCAATELKATGTEGIYAATFTVPAGQHEVKAVVGGSWDTAYGIDGGADNIPLSLAGPAQVAFQFDASSHRLSIALPEQADTGGYTAADDALATAPFRHPGGGENFYFVLTDRFADGDPANNTGGLSGDRMSTGFDPADKGFYQGGDIAGIRQNLDYIEGLGTTAIWLTPSFTNNPVQGEGANASAGYHGYWVTDFTTIDPHLGTNEELKALIDDAHARGIDVYFDIIVNHTADLIDYEEGQYSYIDQKTSPYRDAAGNPVDVSALAGSPAFPAMDPEISFPYTPVRSPENAVMVPQALNDVTMYHNRGNSTWQGESVTFGDFDGLDDLMTEDPRVLATMEDIYTTWMDFGIDGYRIDTVKHVDFDFWKDFTATVKQHQASTPAGEEFFTFGEVYDADAAKLSPYVRDTDMSSVLDFAFQSSALNFAKGYTTAGMHGLYDADDYYTTPDSSAADLPTFLGNHDMGRIGNLLGSSDRRPERDALAHATMFLTRGQPVVYYGDEQGFVGDGADKDARQSLFPSQVPSYLDDVLVDGTPYGSGSHYGTDGALYQEIAELSALRSSSPALATGAQIELHADSGAGVYAFSRVDRTEKIEHVVALNNATSPRTVTLTTLTPGATYTGLYGTEESLTADGSGQLTLTVPALSAVVLKAGTTVAAAGPEQSISLDLAPGSALEGLAPISASVSADRWAETSFSYRLAGQSAWTSLGTAEDDTPRVFHDVRALPRGTVVEYRAVSTDASGARVAASSTGVVGVDLGTEAPTPGEGEVGPEDVTVPGSHNAAMGCAGDWMPACSQARLTLDEASGLYTATFDLPAGDFEYKAAVGGTWDESYGAGGVPGGDNIRYTHAGGPITFWYDPATHVVQNSAQGPIITLPGSFDAALGCAGDWAPDCMRTWMTDGDGDGVYEFSTTKIPAGAHEVKVAHGRSWDENYGQDGAPGGANYTFTTAANNKVTFRYTLATHTLEILVEDPPVTGSGQSLAHFVDRSTIAWPANLTAAGSTYALWSAPTGGIALADGAVTGGTQLGTLSVASGGLTDAQLENRGHLRGLTALHLAGVSDAQLEEALTGQLVVVSTAADGTVTALTGVQIPGVLDDLYAEDAAGQSLGATFANGAPTLRLWAPTAKSVQLELFDPADPAAAPQRIAMARGAGGVWTVAGDASWEDREYLFDVEVFVPPTGAVEHNEVTDPYSVGLTVNSTRSILTDLSDPRWSDETWAKTPAPRSEQFADQSIYELHVRDFSAGDKTVPADERGTYAAFGAEGSDGTARLKELAAAGITTVHLLPTFDIATIEEDRAAQLQPQIPADAGPASPLQQAAVKAVAAKDAYNWGYDPFHYMAPEGSYARDGHQVGGERTKEYRGMVGDLHAMGLQVVLDQVYNHTAASGQDPKSVLDQVVPGYYQRLSLTGAVETSTCCSNIATEHAMSQKLMVDSTVLWAKAYKVDGFRFDLMGHHSRENMEAVRDALDELTLEKDGVDGKSMYLYGEGWDFGEVAGDARFEQATQGQLNGTSIGAFNDRLRDGVHGGSPFDTDKRTHQGFGNGLYTDPNSAAVGTPEEQRADLLHRTDLIRVGLTGSLADYELTDSHGKLVRASQIDYNGAPAGYTSRPEEAVNYVDAHDNETLWDMNVWKMPQDSTMESRVRMNTLSLATVALGQSPSFWASGTDLLRSKSLDRDSYDSGDHFNAIDWTGQDNGFGRGLPPEGKNKEAWPLMGPMLENEALYPAPADISASADATLDLLRLRRSSQLFTLGDADAIREKVSFPNAGPDATPGVLVMRIDDTKGTDADPLLDGVVVVFNASDEDLTETIDAMAGTSYALSDVQAAGSDQVVKRSSWDAATGTATVPARTVAVFVAKQDSAPFECAFTDVPASLQFHDDICWAAEQGYVTGWADGSYRPVSPVNRDAMAAFLYRMAGSPAVDTSGASPFTDIKAGDEHYAAVLWAYQEGITTGWVKADGTREFRPVTPIDRDAMAAFVYRYAGEPAASAPAAGPFSDVPAGLQYAKEIAWLKAQGITTGFPDGSYRPWGPMNRDAMAAFMHRMDTAGIDFVDN